MNGGESFGSAISGRVARVYWRTLIALIPLIAFYLAALTVSQTDVLIDFGNRAGPIYFFMVLSVCGYRVLAAERSLIWTPVFWLVAESAIFFALGPLVAVFGNDVTRNRLGPSYLGFNDWELTWANQLSTVGVWFLLLGMVIHITVARKAWNSALSHHAMVRPTVSSVHVGIIFVLLGALLEYGFAMPARWGVLDIVVPGFLMNVTSLLDVGLAIFAYRAARGDKGMRAALIVLLPIHVLGSGLTFSKQEIVIALLLPALGDLLGRGNIRRFGILVAGIVIIYSMSQNFVHYGRAQIAERTGTIWQAGYNERFEIAASYLGGREISTHGETEAGGEYQGWWTRLSYTGVQVAARDLRLAGVPNDSLSGAWLYFIPRMVWPDKPVIVGPGWYFYKRLTGREGTFLGVSIYGDLFWLGGWIATALGAAAIGWLFAVLSLRSARIVRNRDFLMFPLVLLALKGAIFGPTNFVVNGVIALLPVYVAYSILMHLIQKYLRNERSRRRSQGIRRTHKRKAQDLLTRESYTPH